MTNINCKHNDIHNIILGHSFLFLWPFSLNFPGIFTPYKQKMTQKQINCTGCVNTEYRGGDTFTFLFCMETIRLISITKLITS